MNERWLVACALGTSIRALAQAMMALDMALSGNLDTVVAEQIRSSMVLMDAADGILEKIRMGMGGQIDEEDSCRY